MDEFILVIPYNIGQIMKKFKSLNSYFQPDTHPNRLFVAFSYDEPDDTKDSSSAFIDKSNYEVMETDYENYAVGN